MIYETIWRIYAVVYVMARRKGKLSGEIFIRLNLSRKIPGSRAGYIATEDGAIRLGARDVAV